MPEKAFLPDCKLLTLTKLEQTEAGWQVEADGPDQVACPECQTASRSRHSRYWRTFKDLPTQGSAVTLRVHVSRWHCRNSGCQRRFFSTQFPTIAVAYSRQTSRAEVVTLAVGQALGGRGAERLMSGLGMPVSDDTILRRLKHTARRSTDPKTRVVGIDDWAQRKGHSYGTIFVDLERRCVVDLLPDRSAETVAGWLAAHPEVHTISRDRNGRYAQGARKAAPNATQVADRFHLIQNLREMVERELAAQRSHLGVRLSLPAPPVPVTAETTEPALFTKGRTVQPLSTTVLQRDEIARQRREQNLELFAAVTKLRGAGWKVNRIADKLGLNRRRFDKWLKWGNVPERNRMAPRPNMAESFREYLWQRWQEGCRNGRELLAEIVKLGYLGRYSRLALILSEWRRPSESDENASGSTLSTSTAAAAIEPAFDEAEVAAIECLSLRRQISPQIAAALLAKPRPKLTSQQGEIVDQLKKNCPGFAAMRTMALSFQGILQNGTVRTLQSWLERATASGLHSLKQFARTLRQDLPAVEAAILQKWSNGPVEGQVNRLKTIKRQMYGRAGIDLLRARLILLPAK